MTLKATIVEDMKTAMRAKDTARLSTIRLLLAAIKQREVDERIELTDADVLAIIDKMIKQRSDRSRSSRRAGARPRRRRARRNRRAGGLHAGAARPRPKSSADRRRRSPQPARRRRRHGQGDGESLKPKLAGRADMGAVSARIKAKLAG